MKRFEFAADVSKQLITLSAAIVTVAVTYYDKFLDHGLLTTLSEFAAVLILIASAGSGVLSIGALTSLVEEQEKRDAMEKPGTGDGTEKESPMSLVGTSASRLTQVQQILFFAGLLIFSLITLVSTTSHPLSQAAPLPSSPCGQGDCRCR